MNYTSISQSQAADLIQKSNGKLFSVAFTKRSTGTVRRMVARIGVSKGVTGQGSSYDAWSNGLIRAHEFVSLRDTGPSRKANLLPPIRCTETQWRSIPIEGIQFLKIGGKAYQVE